MLLQKSILAILISAGPNLAPHMLLLHKNTCTCCSCLKLEFFWYIKLTSIWRMCLEPVWGCVPLEQKQSSSQFTWEAQEQTGLGTRSTSFPSCPPSCLAEEAELVLTGSRGCAGSPSHPSVAASPGQGQRAWAAASQAGSALTLLEDEDAVSRTITLPTPGCSCHKHQEGLAVL